MPIVSHNTTIPTPGWEKKFLAGLSNGRITAKTSVILANCYQPTAAIIANPLKLTDAQIAKYGFPPKQLYAHDNAITEWVNIVQHSLHRSCMGTPEIGAPKNSSPPASSANTSLQPNKALAYHENPQPFARYDQAGYIMKYDTNTGVRWMAGEGTFTIPSMPYGYSSSNQACWKDMTPLFFNTCDPIGQSSWVGLSENAAGSPLIQEGVQQQATDAGGGTFASSHFNAWVQDTQDGGPVDAGFTNLTVGDTIYGITTWNAGGSGLPEMIVQDKTHTNYFSWVGTNETSTENEVFDCVMENNGYDDGPYSGAAPTQMATEYWTQCDGEDANGYHHEIAGSNNYAYTNLEILDRANPGSSPNWRIDEYSSAACGAGCGGPQSGGFYIVNQVMSLGDGKCAGGVC
jgi:hypothetical protein